MFKHKQTWNILHMRMGELFINGFFACNVLMNKLNLNYRRLNLISATHADHSPFWQLTLVPPLIYHDGDLSSCTVWPGENRMQMERASSWPTWHKPDPCWLQYTTKKYIIQVSQAVHQSHFPKRILSWADHLLLVQTSDLWLNGSSINFQLCDLTWKL